MERLNVDRLLETLGDILSEKHGVSITLRAEPRDEETEEKIA